MIQQDKTFMTQFSMVLGVLVIIAIICFLLAKSVASDGVAHDDSVLKLVEAHNKNARLTAESRIEPVGRIVQADSEEAKAEAEAEPEQVASAEQAASGDSGNAAAAADMDGETVYKQACFACHDTGAANAPKRGDDAIWATRYEKGLETLHHNAINGFKGMPPKGGRADLSDQSVKNAVLYMLQESGIEAQ